MFQLLLYQAKTKLNWLKLLEDGFNRSVYWNGYQTKIEKRNLEENNFTRFSLAASFQGVRRLFVLVFNNTDGDAKQVERNSHSKYFLPRVNIINYHALL